jgi:hypothetical protein
MEGSMMGDYAVHNVIASILAGGGIGLVVGFVFRRPRGWIAFGALLLLMVLSPWIGVNTWLYAITDAQGNPANSFIIHCNIFLFALTFALNAGFIGRVLRGYKPGVKVR